MESLEKLRKDPNAPLAEASWKSRAQLREYDEVQPDRFVDRLPERFAPVSGGG